MGSGRYDWVAKPPPRSYNGGGRAGVRADGARVIQTLDNPKPVGVIKPVAPEDAGPLGPVATGRAERKKGLGPGVGAGVKGTQDKWSPVSGSTASAALGAECCGRGGVMGSEIDYSTPGHRRGGRPHGGGQAQRYLLCPSARDNANKA